MFDFHKKLRTAFIADTSAAMGESVPATAEIPDTISLTRMPGETIRVATAASMPAPFDVIKDFASVPNGIAVGGLANTADQSTQMVALEVASEAGRKQAKILVLPEWFGAAPALDLRRQLEALGYGKPEMLRATADVIAHVQAIRHSVQTASPSTATKPERLITDILQLAVEKGASDIHVETRHPVADVFFRIDGQRRLMQNLTFDTAKDLAQVLFLKGDEGSKAVDWNSSALADCGISWPLDDGRPVGVRFSSLPIHPSPNFHFVLRIQSKRAEPMELAQCGYTSAMLSMIDTFLAASTGLTVFCGPTNSGKSLSLAGCMRRVYEMRGQSIKQITAESPVENVVPGACQVSVGGQLDFAQVLKGILRQDADVVVPGEIRDAESASVVRDMVLGGRKVLTTLHTYSALGAFVRLREMGVPWDLLTMPGFINGVVYQRLVPTLCPQCKIPLEAGRHRVPSAVFSRLVQTSVLAADAIYLRGDGCAHCDQSGVSGRTVVAEFLVPDRQFLQLLERNALAAAEQYWLQSKVLAIGSHGVTALSHAVAKMQAGQLDPVDLEQNVALLTSELTMADASAIQFSGPGSHHLEGAAAGLRDCNGDDAAAFLAPRRQATFRKTGT